MEILVGGVVVLVVVLFVWFLTASAQKGGEKLADSIQDSTGLGDGATACLTYVAILAAVMLVLWVIIQVSK